MLATLLELPEGDEEDSDPMTPISGGGGGGGDESGRPQGQREEKAEEEEDEEEAEATCFGFATAFATKAPPKVCIYACMHVHGDRYGRL